MISSRIEKKSMKFLLKLIILFLFSHLTLILILYFTLSDIFLTLLISNIALVIFIIIFCYYYKKEKEIPLEENVNYQCPHHPEIEVVTFCKTCGNPICKHCENFKLEMRNIYQHNFRINHKLFEQTLCMDCILQKLNLTTKILLVLGPLFSGVGFAGILAWLFEILNSIIHCIFGTIIAILGIVLIILVIFINTERKKIFTQFSQS